MHRTLPPLRLANSPLVFVLGQVRFEPILAIPSFVPAIQDAFRRKGFTGLINRNLVMPRIQGDQVVPENTPQWEFHDADKLRSFLVDQQGLTLQTTSYRTFELFLEDFQTGLEILESQAHPQTIQRLGLRYVDLIKPATGKNLADYVCAGLHGIQLERHGTRLGQSYETILSTSEKRRYIARYTEAKHGMALPPDLHPVNLNFIKPIITTVPFAVLDTDHFEVASSKFTTPDALSGLAELHDQLDQVFRLLVTPRALEEWQ